MAGDVRTGGCRCGAIRYEVTGPPVASVACHCRDCQYVSGGGADYSMVFQRDGFRVLKGTPRVYKAKPTSGGSFFCKSCGVHVFSGPDSSPHLGSKPNKAWSSTSAFGPIPDIGHAEQFVRD